MPANNLEVFDRVQPQSLSTMFGETECRLIDLAYV